MHGKEGNGKRKRKAESGNGRRKRKTETEKIKIKIKNNFLLFETNFFFIHVCQLSACTSAQHVVKSCAILGSMEGGKDHPIQISSEEEDVGQW